jgi:S-adenosyl-L-methionine hydrolase (adenosine-forming)
VAADLASGRASLADVGEPAGALVPAWVEEASAVGNEVHGVVITLDHFGNLITNIDAALIQHFHQPQVLAGNHSFPMLRTYGETQPGEYLALINSFGVVEIAQAEQSAAEGLGLGRGAPVLVRETPPGHVQLKGRADRL